MMDPATTLALVARVRELEAQVERVWKLHNPDELCNNPEHTNRGVSCPYCVAVCIQCGSVDWPCSTIKALGEES